MRTVDSTPFPARERPRRRVRVVQPPPRRRLVHWEPAPHPNTADRPTIEPAPTPLPTARWGDGKVGRGAARAAPEDATLRALFRVAAAAVARRGEPKP